MIGEGLVLGPLVLVYEIPYSSCIFNTAIVLEPGHDGVCLSYYYLVHRSCRS